VFVSADEGVDGVLGLFEDGVFVVGVGLGEGGVVGDVVLAHVLPPELVEIGRVVVHLRGVLVSESHQLEDLTAVDAPLQRTLPQHQPQQLMRFIIVLVGGARTANEAEGRVRSEDYGGIVNSSEVGQLHAFQVVIGLQVEGVAAEVRLPLRRNLVKALSGEVGLDAVLDT
jgi:hypothetical protein